MVMVVDFKNSTLELGEFKDRLAEKGQELGLVVNVQHEDVFDLCTVYRCTPSSGFCSFSNNSWNYDS